MRKRLFPVALVVIAALGVFGATAGVAAADGELHAELRLGGRDTPHVGLPFALDLIIEGMDESPRPDVPKLDIANATVTFAVAQPNVQRGIQIINGQRSEFSKVTWVLEWKVEPHKEGRMHIPAVTVTQGSKKISSQAAEVDADTIPVSDSMKLSLTLPERPIFVGETVPVTLSWLFRSDPSDPKWSIPLMTTDAFTVSGPPVSNPRKALSFPAGAKELQLPYDIDQVNQNGTTYSRLTATFFLAPRKVGKLDVPASSVVAGLAVGRPDFFGNAASRLYRATDQAHTLEVKPLPETDKPANFAGAVGDQFSVDVQTSRSVVKLGEPVELAIRIKSNQRLDTLALGRLDGAGGLPKDKFEAPAESPTGELSEDGKTKTFKVTVLVTGATTEIPAIAFAYFDPTKSTYQTIHSDPIALSVAGGNVVGANDVVAAAPVVPAKGSGAPSAGNTLDAEASTVGAELALASAGQDDDQPLSGAPLWILIGLLYAVPIALLAGRSWQVRTQGQREEAAEVRAARRKVEDLLDRSGSEPARDIAGPLAASLRELARSIDRGPSRPLWTGEAGPFTPPRVESRDSSSFDDGGLLAKLETESFSQGASSVPLSTDLRSDAAGLLRRWTAEARRSRKPRGNSAASAAMLAVLLGTGLLASRADAAPGTQGTQGTLDDARAAYRDAMQLTNNASARKAAFARAEAAFGEAVRTTPDRPELLADWGNAALGAGDVATATLAFRRALALDGGNLRARHNLAWLRGRQADSFRPATGGATDTLLFFHAWPRGRKLVVGSAAFAIAILLVVPWSGRRRRGLAGLALLPFAVWLAMLASVVFEDRHPNDAIVMDAGILRAADSAGAPAALATPLARGVEVTIVERRDAWTKVRLAGGQAGWLPSSTVERITR